MNFDLEMWKYANQVKQRSADPLIGHEHRPNAHAHLMGVDVDINDLLDAVKTQDSSKLWVTPADPHPNGYANGLFAAYLFPAVQKAMP